MWREEQQDSLRERIRQMSDEELIKMVCEDASQYRQNALQAAEAELAARGIELVDEDATAQAEGEFFHGRKLDEALLTCRVCHGEMRKGYLYGQKEVIVMFTDNSEERFVEVLACSRCGQVRLLVDYETEVDG